MFSVTLSFLTAVYVGGACALIFALWIFYDRRDRKLYDLERRRAHFHCIRCDRLYTDRGAAETSVCPRCKFENQRLTF